MILLKIFYDNIAHVCDAGTKYPYILLILDFKYLNNNYI